MSSLLSLAAAAPAADKDLPVLFSFKQPTHNVAVFRGADLKNAIASGLVKGFGSGSGAGLGDGGEARRGKSVVVAPAGKLSQLSYKLSYKLSPPQLLPSVSPPPPSSVWPPPLSLSGNTISGIIILYPPQIFCRMDQNLGI